MFLMNVPPVVATPTEWRTCSPPGSYSLPACFNDSDTEQSTRGTPITEKVQMIIESLRSTQSSLEMGDEIEGNGVSGQDGHPQHCKIAVGSFVDARSKATSLAEQSKENFPSPNNCGNSDTDSDDSVDRGIEEAIQEYLKEKDDHKRKGEPCDDFLPSSKISRKSPSFPTSDGNPFLFDSNQFPQNVKAEVSEMPAAIPVKQYMKNKASLHEDVLKKFELTKQLPQSSNEQQEESPSTATLFIDAAVHCPVKVKVDSDSDDSSSDDGIEEAIQKYQLEKNEQQNRKQSSSPHASEDESDSTSDDGIEEAICRYQIEQLEERSGPKPFLHKEKLISNSVLQGVVGKTVDKVTNNKLSRSKARSDKDAKVFQSLPSSSFLPKTTLLDSSRKINVLLPVKVEGQKEQQVCSSKVNTTAELMCAEAILDISKTVMPGAFHQTVGLSSGATAEHSLHSSLPDNGLDDESSDSSVDSEDGIEQEIKKFLEQKAQMQKQPNKSPAATQEIHGVIEPEILKPRQDSLIQKQQKLSLTQRRKNKEKSVSNVSSTDDARRETVSTSFAELVKESKPSAFTKRSQTQLRTELRRADQCGDKSSSLDSDEDLDSAIKDLLKTKKKSKKKPKDLKRKPRKCLKDEQSVIRDALQTKTTTIMPDPVSKFSALKKTQKSKDGMKDKVGQGKKTVFPNNTDSERLKGLQGNDYRPSHTEEAPHVKEDSTSVDSDDSIELEIRRFLAEKAKGSSVEDVTRNGKEVKEENQPAEVSIKCSGTHSGQTQTPLIDQAGEIPQISTSQSLQQNFSPTNEQWRPLSVSSCSPRPLEPAGGANAEQCGAISGTSNVQNITPAVERERARPAAVTHSRSEAIKWRQSFGLPISASRVPVRTPFQITTSNTSETASATSPFPSTCPEPKSQTPVGVWSCSRTSRSPFPGSTVAALNNTTRSTVLNFFSTAKQHPRILFPQGIMPEPRLSQGSVEGERESTVHIPKDKSVFVELESNRTNHVQVQSREKSEETQSSNLLSDRKREGECTKVDEEEEKIESKEEEFIDEADSDSVIRRNPEKKQGFPTLSLSSAIDPGIPFRPCIALTSEERGMMFHRRYQDSARQKARASQSIPKIKGLKHVKRKLQFTPTGKGKTQSLPHNNENHFSTFQ